MLNTTTSAGDDFGGTRKCHDAIAARDADPVILPRENAKLWKHDTRGGLSTQRSGESLKVSRPRTLATGERIPPQKPR